MFKKYPKIENKLERPPFDCEFVIGEKLHGVNFQLDYDRLSKELIAGRRNGPLKQGDKFYNWQDILVQYGSSVVSLSSYLDNQSIKIYGELYGPGVQKEIKYCDTVRFIVFDVYLPEVDKFLDYDLMYDLAAKAGFHVVKPLERGLFEDLVKFDVQNKPTTIPEELDRLFGLDLPQKRLENNFMEGIVLRPVVEPPKIQDFDPDIPESTISSNYEHRHNRYVFKIKSDKFLEKATPWKSKPEDSEDMTSKLEIFQEYINANRFNAVRSKEEEIQSMKEIPKYIKLMYQDIVEDLLKDDPEFELKDKKIIGRVNGLIAQLVRTEINSLLTTFV